MNRVKCPNCNKGWDTDGDGNCPCCLPKRLRPINGQPEEELRFEREENNEQDVD